MFDGKPMPNPEIIVAKVGQDKFISKLDKGYWQIPMKLEDIEKTTFLRNPRFIPFQGYAFWSSKRGRIVWTNDAKTVRRLK